MDKPIFVKVDEYDDIKEIIGLIKSKIAESKETLRKVHQLKEQEEQEIHFWAGELDDVERKIANIDSTLFG